MQSLLDSSEDLIVRTTDALSPTLVWLQLNLWSMAMGLVILVVGVFLSRVLSRQAASLLPRTGRIDNTLTPLVSQLVRYGILLVTLVIVLSQFGVQTASVLAVLGAAGLAIALALQGTLSNLAAGVLLIWLRPLSVGEYIDAEGATGTVVEVGLFGTRLRNYDGVFNHVPNSRLWGARIVNFSRERNRMVEIKIGIGYTADIAKARSVMLEVATDPRVLPDPAPLVFVDDLGESAVTIGLRAWVLSSDWWKARVDFVERIKLAFDSNGIEIPYNKLDLYLKREKPPAD